MSEQGDEEANIDGDGDGEEGDVGVEALTEKDNS